MENNLPISSAIEKIIDLFGFKERVEVNTYNGNKVWCIVDEKENEFLEHIIKEETTNLAPVLIIPSKTEKDAPLYLFKELSKKFPDRFRYLDFPFNIVEFLNAVEALNHSTVNNNNGNPFKDLEKLTEQLKELSLKRWEDKIRNGGGKDNGKTEFEKNVKEFEKRLNVKPSFSIIFGELSKNAAFGDEDRLKEFHDIGSAEISMQLFLSYQCCLEYIYEFLGKKCEKGKKVLWIENKPANIEEVNEILKNYFKYEIDMRSEASDITRCFEELQKGANDYKDYDLVLIDIFLDVKNEENKLDGKDFLRIISQKYPHIPAFIVSASEDLELISNTLKEGADYYILKKYAVSIPHYLRKFHERIGKIVLLIEDEELRSNLIGNIRRWRLNKESLWFGDKCYHMINHSYNHAENDWGLMNQIFPVFYEKLCNINKKKVTDEDIYCLSMATWLHDIGHSGNEQYGEPHHIRDTHSVISAEFILKHPDHYGIFGFNDKDHSPYRYITFRHPKTALQCIRERISCFNAAVSLYNNKGGEDIQKTINRQMILEKIALMCIYHSSKFPIDDDDVKKITEKRSLSRECYENLDKKTEPVHLASIASLMGDENILKLTSILRFIDALDHNKNRVGDTTSRSIKVETIRRDLRYQISKLESEVNLLINFSKISQEKAKRFRRLFFEDVERFVLEKNHVPKDLKNEQRRFLDNFEGVVDTTNYDLLLEYIQFICVQEGHFDLHNSIESIDIETVSSADGRILMDIKFKSLKDKRQLEVIEIKNWDEEKSKKLDKYLLGERDENFKLKKIGGKFVDKGEGYIGKELLSSENYIKDFIDIDGHKAGIYDIKKKLLFPETSG